MSLKEILETNARFLAETRPGPMPHEPRKHWAVVSCMDFRLSTFLEDALGVKRGDAIMIRNAGNTRTPLDAGVLRSLFAGVLLFDIREVLVIGHTRCGMRMDAMKAADRMRELGIPREALGRMDLREALGLIPDEAENVRQMVDAIAASPLIPKSIAIYGFVIDVESGRLEFVSGRVLAGEVTPTATSRVVETGGSTAPTHARGASSSRSHGADLERHDARPGIALRPDTKPDRSVRVSPPNRSGAGE